MRVTRYPYDVSGWGVGEIWVRDGIVVQHELAREELRVSPQPRAALRNRSALPPNGEAGLPAGTVSGEQSRRSAGIVSDLRRRIATHLGGDSTAYHGIAIDLDWATPLQHELAAAARAIPWGEVVSYGELAALAGRPGAARAAGSFCADNRYALIIPCHRVIAANGIGGYGTAGPAMKRRLLALEGVHL